MDKHAFLDGYLYKAAVYREDLPLRERVEVVATKGDKVLLKVRDGYVEMPGGGISAGEDMKSAVRRECMEETGASLKNIRRAGVVESAWYQGIKEQEWGKEMWDKYRGTRTHFYTAEVDGALSPPTSEEGDAWTGSRLMPMSDALKEMHKQVNTWGMLEYRDKQRDLVEKALLRVHREGL